MTDPSQLFASDVGTWDGEIDVRPQPGAPLQHSRGVMTNRMVGPWLVCDFKNETGFEGHGIYGWDAAKQSYVATWIDSTRSSLVIGIGTFDAAARTMTYRYEQGPMKWRDVVTFPDEDTQLFRSILALPSGEHEVVTGTYRRRRS
jgi:hypothetical protein